MSRSLSSSVRSVSWVGWEAGGWVGWGAGGWVGWEAGGGLGWEAGGAGRRWPNMSGPCWASATVPVGVRAAAGIMIARNIAPRNVHRLRILALPQNNYGGAFAAADR